MDIILAIVIFVLILAFESLGGVLFDFAFFRWHSFISKLVVAFLAGFIVFVIFTPRIPMVQQRVAVIIVSLLLIYANLFLGKKKEETEEGEKEYNRNED